MVYKIQKQKEVAEKDSIILPKQISIIAKKDSPVISCSDTQIPFFPQQAKNTNENFFLP